MGVSVVGIVLQWRLVVHAADPVRAFHETFFLLGAICAAAVVAAWRMKPEEADKPAGPGDNPGP